MLNDVKDGKENSSRATFSPRFKIKRRGLTKNFQDTMLNDVKRGIPNSINSSINIASRGSLSDPRSSSPR